MAFWVGIGSIVTRSGAGRALPVSCSAVPPSHNTSAVGEAALRWASSEWLCSGSVLVSVTCVGSRTQSGLQRFYSLSYMWYSGFSCLSVVLVGLAVSLLTGMPAPLHYQCLAHGSALKLCPVFW